MTTRNLWTFVAGIVCTLIGLLCSPASGATLFASGDTTWYDNMPEPDYRDRKTWVGPLDSLYSSSIYRTNPDTAVVLIDTVYAGDDTLVVTVRPSETQISMSKYSFGIDQFLCLWLAKIKKADIPVQWLGNLTYAEWRTYPQSLGDYCMNCPDSTWTTVIEGHVEIGLRQDGVVVWRKR